MASQYQTLATMALVAMVALAGCVGGLTDSGTPTPTSESNSSVPESTSSNSTSDSQPDYVNVTEFRVGTQSSLDASGSYTASVREITQSASQSNNLTVDQNATYLVDTDTNRSLITSEVVSVDSTDSTERESIAYVDGEVIYNQFTNESGTYYSAFDYTNVSLSPRSTPNTNTLSDPLLIITLFDGWVEQESTSRDGVSVTRYTGTQIAESGEAASRVNITDGSADIYVDSEGMVRAVEANFTYQTRISNNAVQTNVSYSLTNINSTTVEDPNWTSEAPEPQSVEDAMSP